MTIKTADGNRHTMAGIGDVLFSSAIKDMKTVWYVPDVTKNLLSVGKITDLGYGIYFYSHGVYIFDKPPSIKKTSIIAHGTRGPWNGVQATATQATRSASSHDFPDLATWHARLGHLSIQSIELMSRRQVAKGIPSNLIFSANHVCSHCQIEHQTRERAPYQASRRATRLLAFIHTDLCGPEPASLSGTSYLLPFIDDYNRFTWLYFIKQKRNTLSIFK